MKTRFFPLVSLLALTLLLACAPPAPKPTASPLTGTDIPATLTPAVPTVATSTVPPIQVIATSRGPQLEATDPNTVSLASGQLQLVEFFRFT
jgi:hypothetical protein